LNGKNTSNQFTSNAKGAGVILDLHNIVPVYEKLYFQALENSLTKNLTK